MIVLSITQNYPSALWFSKHYWVLSYLEIIGWTQSLQFRNEPTFWRQNNCTRIHCSSWDVVTHQHSGDHAIDLNFIDTSLITSYPTNILVTMQFITVVEEYIHTSRNSPTFWWPCNKVFHYFGEKNGSRNSPTFWRPCNSTTFKSFVNAGCSTLFAVGS